MKNNPSCHNLHFPRKFIGNKLYNYNNEITIWETPCRPTLFSDHGYAIAFEVIEGISQTNFILNQTKLMTRLGFPVILSNNTAYWESRQKWKLIYKKYFVSGWCNIKNHDIINRKKRVSFNNNITIYLINSQKKR